MGYRREKICEATRKAMTTSYPFWRELPRRGRFVRVDNRKGVLDQDELCHPFSTRQSADGSKRLGGQAVDG
jgi:hypothetical protein